MGQRPWEARGEGGSEGPDTEHAETDLQAGGSLPREGRSRSRALVAQAGPEGSWAPGRGGRVLRPQAQTQGVTGEPPLCRPSLASPFLVTAPPPRPLAPKGGREVSYLTSA